MMPNCRSNRSHENWAHTLKFKPDRYCEPQTEQEIIQIVQDALATNGRVRPAGGGHSWSDLVVTDSTLVQLDDIDRRLVADIPNHRYTVQAGIRLQDLIESLAADGLALKNLGSITEQSIAGAISTGTHGTGLRLGNLSSSIFGMKLVTGTGDLLTITESDTDLLNAARVSLGALGIITEVTIDCVPLYDLEYTAYSCKFDDVIDRLETLNLENVRFLLWWLVAPIGPKDNVIVITMNPPGTPAGSLGQSGSVPGGPANRDPLPMDTNDLSSHVLGLSATQPCQRFIRRTGRYDRMLTIPLLPVFHRECEYAVPVENASAVLRVLRRIIEERDISTTLPIEVRFVARDHILLSPANGRDVCYIGVATQPNANEVYARVEPIMKAFGGRPHWGKHFSLTRREVQEMYPDTYDTFSDIRKQLDPQGVFGNTLLREIFDYT